MQHLHPTVLLRIPFQLVIIPCLRTKNRRDVIAHTILPIILLSLILFITLYFTSFKGLGHCRSSKKMFFCVFFCCVFLLESRVQLLLLLLVFFSKLTRFLAHSISVAIATANLRACSSKSVHCHCRNPGQILEMLRSTSIICNTRIRSRNKY